MLTLAHRFLIVIGFSLLISGAAFADQMPGRPIGALNSGRELRFDIPAQPLLTALEAFATQSTFQLLYKSGIAQGRQSTAVIGKFTEEGALERLLDGTGLSATYVTPTSVSLTPIVLNKVVASVAPSSGAAATLALAPLRVEGDPYDVIFYDAYAQVVQARIRRVLLSGSGNAMAGHRIKIMVWVDEKGVIQRSAIFSSSGDSRVDTKVLQQVNGLAVLEQPPAGLPQPLHVRIRVPK